MFHYSVSSLVTKKEDCHINRKATVHVFQSLQSTTVGRNNLKKKKARVCEIRKAKGW